MNGNSPCCGCTAETGRSGTCHCTCKKYLDWHEQQLQKNKEIFDKKQIECGLRENAINGALKYKKRTKNSKIKSE